MVSRFPTQAKSQIRYLTVRNLDWSPWISFRLCTRRHVSQAVRHLAGEGADFMTGQTAILDGGRIVR